MAASLYRTVFIHRQRQREQFCADAGDQRTHPPNIEPFQGGAAPKPPVQWRGAMNDARGYRGNAAQCPLAAKSCQPCYHTLLRSPLLMAFARPADVAIDALLLVQ
jgi:hypothetical protein